MLTGEDTLRQEQYRAICRQVMAKPIPEALRDEVSKICDALLSTAAVGLTVRSSGLREDGEHASFAGIFNSYAGIMSEEELWEAIRKCWCAAWSTTALDYARKMGVLPALDWLAVIIQHLVPADCSGVVFTAEPMTGNPWQFVIESTLGLAHDLLDAHMPGDRTVIAWDTGDILEQSIALKADMLVAGHEGVVRQAVPPEQQSRMSLSSHQVSALHVCALQIDQLFQTRVDIEWVFAGGRLLIVQCRPITALPDYFPVQLSDDERLLRWERCDHWLSAEEDRLLLPPLYVDASFDEMWFRHQPVDRILGSHLGRREKDFLGYRYHTSDELYATYKTTFPKKDEEQWLDRNEEELREKWELSKIEDAAAVRTMRNAITHTCTAGELIPTFITMWHFNKDMESRTLSAPQWLGYMCAKLLEQFRMPYAPDFELERLRLGLETNSYQRTFRLQQLGKNIYEEEVKRLFTELPLDQIIPYLAEHHPDCQFLRDYTDHCYRFSLTPPGWIGRPRPWLFNNPVSYMGTIRGMLDNSIDDVQLQYLDLIRQRVEAEDEFRAIIRHKAPTQMRRFEKLLAWVQYWEPVLNDRWPLTGNLADDMAWEIGHRLVSEGLLEKPEEIIFLTMDDLRQISDLNRAYLFREKWVARKLEYARHKRLRPPNHLGNVPQPPGDNYAAPAVHEATAEHQAQSFTGQGKTPWSASGITRKTGDWKDAQLLSSLTKEDILLCTGRTLDYHNDVMIRSSSN